MVKQSATEKTSSVTFALASAVYAWSIITANCIDSSFRVISLYAFKRDFARKFKTDDENLTDALIEELERQGNKTLAARRSAVRRCHSDKNTLHEVVHSLPNEHGSLRAQRAVLESSHKHTTVHSVMQTSVGS